MFTQTRLRRRRNSVHILHAYSKFLMKVIKDLIKEGKRYFICEKINIISYKIFYVMKDFLSKR